MSDSILKTEEGVNGVKADRTLTENSPPTLKAQGTSDLDDQILSVLDNTDFCKPKLNSMVSAHAVIVESSSDESEGELEDGDFQTTAMGYIPLPQNSDEEIEIDDDERVPEAEPIPSSRAGTREDQNDGVEQHTVIHQSNCEELPLSRAEATNMETSKKWR